jgi:predicted DNA-binding transcriptional regulator YafY
MPKNKDALIRYRVINRCFREKKSVSLQELRAACERALDIYPISERTIEADISAMRNDGRLGYNAPIKMDRINRVYYYEDPEYSIDNIPLNEEELESLVFASRLLEQFKGIEILKKFSGSVQKLVEAVNIYRVNDDSCSNYIEFEKVDEAKGTEFIEPLIDALKNKKVLKIEYKSFNRKIPSENFIHPYLLKEYRNRWYLIGYNDRYSDIRTYGLDRIMSIVTEVSIDFMDKGFDAKRYYENVIGISVLNKEPLEVHLAFTEFQAQYVITQPLHSSQELISKAKNRYVFKYYLVPNYEFISQILAWGEQIEVLTPISLKKSIKKISNKISSKYPEKNHYQKHKDVIKN